MLNRFLSKVRGLPARTSDWANKAGPVALVGCDYGVPHSGKEILDSIAKGSRDADYYAELTFHEEGPINAPPDTAALMPVLCCGNMSDAPLSTSEWYSAVYESTVELAQKGFVPVFVGGSGAATLPILEGIKQVHADEEIILLHFSASPSVDRPDAPIRVVQEKVLVKGVISVGNRCVSSADRQFRKEKKMFYLDSHALFSKGLFCVRDLRNDFPVYMSIDVSCLDPSCAPGSIITESGGLSVRELVHLMHGIRAPSILGIDIHGYNPKLDVRRGDGSGLTGLAAAKIFKESTLKAYSVSTATQDEGIARVQMMQRQGKISEDPYPEH